MLITRRPYSRIGRVRTASRQSRSRQAKKLSLELLKIRKALAGLVQIEPPPKRKKKAVQKRAAKKKGKAKP